VKEYIGMYIHYIICNIKKIVWEDVSIESTKIWVLLKNQIPDTLTSLLNLSHPQPFIFSSPKSKSLQTRCRWYDRWCSPSLRPHHPFPVGVLFAARMLARSTALICFPAPPCSDFRWWVVVFGSFSGLALDVTTGSVFWLAVVAVCIWAPPCEALLERLRLCSFSVLDLVVVYFQIAVTVHVRWWLCLLLALLYVGVLARVVAAVTFLFPCFYVSVLFVC
jgi:hypothetical protein